MTMKNDKNTTDPHWAPVCGPLVISFSQHSVSIFCMPGTGLGARTRTERQMVPAQSRQDKQQKLKQDAERLGSLLQILSDRETLGTGCSPLKRVA